MNKKELAQLAPELLEALEELYREYVGQMKDQYNYPGRPWTPERDDDTAALKAQALIKKARGE